MGLTLKKYSALWSSNMYMEQKVQPSSSSSVGLFQVFPFLLDLLPVTEALWDPEGEAGG